MDERPQFSVLQYLDIFEPLGVSSAVISRLGGSIPTPPLLLSREPVI